MGRPETSLDPDAGPVQEFARDLRELRRQAGNPSYRELAKRAHYSASMLSTAANGRSLPSLAVTLAFVEACGGDKAGWERRWSQVAEQIAKPEAAKATRSAPLPAGTKRTRWSRRRIWLTGLGAGAVVAAAAALLLGTVLSPSPPTRYVAVTGEGCDQDERSKFGMSTFGVLGSSGWDLSSWDGWDADGCDGTFRYSKGSGDDKPGHDFFDWNFTPGLAGEYSCAIRVYVPNGTFATIPTAYYEVRTADNQLIDEFTVDQAAHQGTWVDTGEVRLSTKRFVVHLIDRGPTDDPIAAAALKVDCHVG